jgi:hypothetical protein
VVDLDKQIKKRRGDSPSEIATDAGGVGCDGG